MTCRSEEKTIPWTIPLTDVEKHGNRRKGGHLAPPDRLCEFCYGRMTPAQTVEACQTCLGQWKRITEILHQVHMVFAVTKTMTRDKVFKVLWDFKWKHRGIGG